MRVLLLFVTWFVVVSDYLITDTSNQRVQLCPLVSGWPCETVAGTGSYGSSAIQFMNPRTAELHGDGRLLVADQNNHRVQDCPLASPGSPCTTVGGVDGGGSGAGQLSSNGGATLDGDGNYVIADTNNHRVQLCSSSHLGNCTTVAGTGASGSGLQQLNQPYHVAIDALGDYVISDTSNRRVMKCPSSSSGLDCELMVSSATATHVLILTSGEYLVTDYIGHRLLLCPPSAEASCATVAGLGGGGTGATQLAHPSAAAVDDNGDYLIADTFNHRLQLCPAASPGADCTTMVGTTGVSGSGASELKYPRHVFMNSTSSDLTTTTNTTTTSSSTTSSSTSTTNTTTTSTNTTSTSTNTTTTSTSTTNTTTTSTNTTSTSTNTTTTSTSTTNTTTTSTNTTSTSTSTTNTTTTSTSTTNTTTTSTNTTATSTSTTSTSTTTSTNTTSTSTSTTNTTTTSTNTTSSSTSTTNTTTTSTSTTNTTTTSTNTTSRSTSSSTNATTTSTSTTNTTTTSSSTRATSTTTIYTTTLTTNTATTWANMTSTSSNLSTTNSTTTLTRTRSTAQTSVVPESPVDWNTSVRNNSISVRTAADGSNISNGSPATARGSSTTRTSEITTHSSGEWAASALEALLHEETEHFFQVVSNVSLSRGRKIQALLAVAEQLLVAAGDLAGNASAQVDPETALGVFTVIGDFASEGLPEDEEIMFETPGGTVLQVVVPSSARVASGFLLGPFSVPPIAGVHLENISFHVISWATNLFRLEDVSETMVTLNVRRDGEHVALDNLDPPLLFFLHVNERLGAFDRSCVFWDTVSGNWSGHGLDVVRANLTQVVCESTHATSFAVRYVSASCPFCETGPVGFWEIDAKVTFPVAIWMGIALVAVVHCAWLHKKDREDWIPPHRNIEAYFFPPRRPVRRNVTLWVSLRRILVAVARRHQS